MANSRQRKTSKRKQQPRRPRPVRSTKAPGGGGIDPALKALVTDQVLEELHLSIEAEADGDADSAIRHFAHHPLADSSPHLRYLYEMRDLGADAPGWVCSRWVLQQAHRWLFLNCDERVHDSMFLTVGSVYSDVDPERPLGRDPHVFVGEVMAIDWMCHQLALYEMGGLRAYLETMAQPSLLRRADRILAWPRMKMSGFRIEEAYAGGASLTDLGTGTRHEVLNIGRLAEGVGFSVVGRLVPMRCEPGWIFDSRPREVSEAVAEEVGRRAARGESRGWATVLGEAVEAGEIAWPLSTLACLSPLSSDLLPYTWSVPQGEFPEAAYEVCVAALDSASHGGRWVIEAAPYVSAVVTNPLVFQAAKDRLTDASYAEAWRALARNTHEPVRARCLELAGVCRTAA